MLTRYTLYNIAYSYMVNCVVASSPCRVVEGMDRILPTLAQPSYTRELGTDFCRLSVVCTWHEILRDPIATMTIFLPPLLTYDPGHVDECN